MGPIPKTNGELLYLAESLWIPLFSSLSFLIKTIGDEFFA
jgi:hypothetical protein